MIWKISGKPKSPSYTHVNHTGAETKSTSKFDIAETLGETFNSKQLMFKKLKKNNNSISSLQIMRNKIVFSILMNFWKQLTNHMNL